MQVDKFNVKNNLIINKNTKQKKIKLNIFIGTMMDIPTRCMINLIINIRNKEK